MFPLELIAPNTEIPLAIGLPPFTIKPPSNEPVSDRIEPVNEPVNEPVFAPDPAFKAKDAVIACEALTELEANEEVVA